MEAKTPARRTLAVLDTPPAQIDPTGRRRLIRLTAAPSGRGFVRTLKYQRRSRRAYSEHRSHSLARRAPSGVRDDKPASWNARPALTSLCGVVAGLRVGQLDSVASPFR
jgi:hypothetical protein